MTKIYHTLVNPRHLGANADADADADANDGPFTLWNVAKELQTSSRHLKLCLR